MQTSNGTSQTSSYVTRKSFNINRQVSVVKQVVSVRSFRYFEQILWVLVNGVMRNEKQRNGIKIFIKGGDNT